MNPTRCAPHSRSFRPSPATPLPAGVRARMRCPFWVAAGAGCLGEVTRMRPTLHSLGDSAVFGLDAPSPQSPMDSSVPGWQRLEATNNALPSAVDQWQLVRGAAAVSRPVRSCSIRCEFTVSGLIGCAPARRARDGAIARATTEGRHLASSFMPPDLGRRGCVGGRGEDVAAGCSGHGICFLI